MSWKTTIAGSVAIVGAVVLFVYAPTPEAKGMAVILGTLGAGLLGAKDHNK